MASKKENKSQTNFQWLPEMIDHLILCLKNYKTEMDYKNVDFNSDVVAMYSRLRERMALAFDAEYFGPVDIPESSDEVLTKEEEKAFQAEVSLAKSLIKKEYNRIKEKIRAIRKAYNKAVTNGTRSGSGKIVQEHYDQLAEIWKGSPATEAPFTRARADFNPGQCATGGYFFILFTWTRVEGDSSQPGSAILNPG